MNRPRAADDFAAIRARMEELRREREGAKPGEKDGQQNPPTLPNALLGRNLPSLSRADSHSSPGLLARIADTG
jgi:hypothetical protein